MGLIVAAGSGSRAAGARPKQFQMLGRATVLGHAASRLAAHAAIDEVRIVIGYDQEDLYRETMGDAAPDPIIGGASRRISVRNGLRALAAEDAPETVLIHDAARPFLPAAVIDRLLKAVEAGKGAVPVLPVVDSLAFGDRFLGAAVNRDALLRVQTPQAFRFADILSAHERWDETDEPTDDAQVARAAGIDVLAVAGDDMLEKLTYPADFERAERRFAPTLVSRTGLGIDVHAFCPGDHVWIGGVCVPHDRGLAGHSDADVALHALTDALLGAISAGDIGDHFPPSDPRWHGAASSLFIEHARMLVKQRGGRIDHVDITILCEAPKIGPHRHQIRQSVANLLGLSEMQVSIKATTTERLGFAGRGEGIAAQAAATIRLPEAS